ncbi:MAG: tRNA uridine-5-carboxymethylaminomethyl(34) synthesis GTPase MnmE, partial [Alphaproteobacteria bacterium]|nr:tRNA uridine-5-carboxymethylaminomethyl(34) synthesis GTPase MnmE [Alphaproteobacteria bacterium]
MDNQTIYALSTVFGKSGVAIIRISGEDALQAIAKLSSINTSTIKPRYAYFTTLKYKNNILDKALVLYFKAPYSFTGEDVVELHIHGSRAVISSVVDVLSDINNFRLAEPGEFSKRAFYNQKMDLTEAEGLADLIDAETSEQQKFAIRQMEGSLKNLYESWRETLLGILAHIEAYIDFPEEDIPDNIVYDMKNTVFKLSKDIAEHISTGNSGERLREGFRVVIVGPPNAGKSSLLNTITKRNAVIVSDIAGTTRDAIDIHLDLGGYPVILTDTAGLRETEELIEQKGIEIAFEKM